MATTKAQIAANGRNATRSTGPRTPRGKAIASRNAVRHGLLAQDVVLDDEDASLFEARRDAICTHLDPRGEIEEELVERIVTCAWRLRRLLRIEVSLLQYHRRAGEVARASTLARTFTWTPPETITDKLRHAAALELRDTAAAARDQETLAIAFRAATHRAADSLTKLSRYEVAIERSFYRALQELQRRQAVRRGRNGGTPPVIDVTGSASAD